VLDGARVHAGAALRRRATWWTGAAWPVTGPFFGLVLFHLFARAGQLPPDAVAQVLPPALPGRVLAGYVPYGAAYLLVLGAVLVGNEYRWSTVTTLLVQRPGRVRLVLAQSAALAAVAALVVAAEFALCAATSWVIAGIEGAPPTGPPPGAVLVSLAACWLVGTTSALIGALLAHALRGPAGAVGIGLGWLLAVETVVRGLLGLLPGTGWAADLLLGPAVGTLAVALGEAPMAGPFGIGEGGPVAGALAVVLGWAVLAVALTALLVHRRDEVGRG
jgi:hypothetical protein